VLSFGRDARGARRIAVSACQDDVALILEACEGYEDYDVCEDYWD
jgi:hypothetical protein